MERFAEELSKTAAFPPDYGNYSVKAIKKLLPLMRSGSDWSWEAIDPTTKERIEKLRTGEADQNIADIVRESVEKALGLEPEREAFQGLPEWLACYIVYNRHAEAGEIKSLRKVEELNKFIKEFRTKKFRTYDLRNPIVQKAIGETLLVVRDLMMEYDIIDIAIELGRELKNSAKERNRITASQSKKQTHNEQLIKLLCELLSGKSPSLSSKNKMERERYSDYYAKLPDEEKKSLIESRCHVSEKTIYPSYSLIEKFLLYWEQHFKSPYSGEFLSLSELLDPDKEVYEVDHIIPRSRFYDDSFSNKVLVEKELNQRKGNKLPLEFFRLEGPNSDDGQFDEAAFRGYVERNYAASKAKPKRERLLAEEIPDDFTSRQLNDTRYISRILMGILSNVVREEGEKEATSKHLLPEYVGGGERYCGSVV